MAWTHPRHLLTLSGLGLTALLLGAGGPADALEPFDVYENWKGKLIRGDRWRGGEGFGGQETKREIAGKKLIVRHRQQGDTSADTGFRNGTQRLNFANPEPVTQVEVTFTVKDYHLQGCSVNEDDPFSVTTRVRPMRILMRKFNDGSSSGPGDQTGDIDAGLQIYRDAVTTDAKDVFRIAAFVTRCADAACLSAPELFPGPFVGEVRGKHQTTLRLSWDEPNDRFIAEVESKNFTSFTELSYAGLATDSAPPASPFVQLSASARGASCTVGSGGPTEGDVLTEVGVVSTNASAIVP
jgi:hypothetical protein